MKYHHHIFVLRKLITILQPCLPIWRDNWCVLFHVLLRLSVLHWRIMLKRLAVYIHSNLIHFVTFSKLKNSLFNYITVISLLDLVFVLWSCWRKTKVGQRKKVTAVTFFPARPQLDQMAQIRAKYTKFPLMKSLDFWCIEWMWLDLSWLQTLGSQCAWFGRYCSLNFSRGRR